MPMSSSRCWDRTPAAPIGAAAASVLLVLCCWLAPAAGQPEVRAVETPTALQLLERMDALLPREGTTVWIGREQVAASVWHNVLARRRSEAAGVQRPPQSAPAVPFTDVISFRPGYYQRYCEADLNSYWGPQFDPWRIWRSDGTLLEVRRPRTGSTPREGDVLLSPHAARLPHELLLQPRRVRDWIDPGTLKLRATTTHWIVSCSSPDYPGPPDGTYQCGVELSFPRDGSTGGLPDRVLLSDLWGEADGKMSDFRRVRTEALLPHRMTYVTTRGWWGRTEGTLRLEKISFRASDGPKPPDTLVSVSESGLDPPMRDGVTTRSNQAPQPLWLLHAREDWKAGYLSLPLASRVPIRRNLPELGAMMTVLCLALWQRARIARERAGRRRRTRTSA